MSKGKVRDFSLALHFSKLLGRIVPHKRISHNHGKCPACLNEIELHPSRVINAVIVCEHCKLMCTTVMTRVLVEWEVASLDVYAE